MSNGSRRGWVMVLTTFITLAVIYGVWYSYAVFLVALIREFGWSRSLLSGAFSLLVTQMLLIHQVAYFVDHGVPALTAAMVGGAVGLVSIPGKAGWGFLSDRAGRELAVTLAFGCVALSIGALALAGRHPIPGLLYLYALLVGLGYSVLSPVFPAIASDLFSGPGFSLIYGTLYGVICLALALGPWVAGRIYDLTGSYGAALWLGLGTTALTPVLVWVIAPRRPNPPPARR